jgi:hypothetical protein
MLVVAAGLKPTTPHIRQLPGGIEIEVTLAVVPVDSDTPEPEATVDEIGGPGLKPEKSLIRRNPD